MTPIRLTDGLPTQGERPVVLLAARWHGSGTLTKDRRWARDLAACGFTGILTEGEQQAEAADAARRAGLLALVPADSTLTGVHIARCEGPLVPVMAGDPSTAFAALCAGARVIAGDEDVLDGLAAFVALAAADAVWEPQPDLGLWQVAAAGSLVAAFGPEGGELDLTLPRGQSLHWFEPTEGRLLGITTPTVVEPQRIATEAGVPMALLAAPTRWSAVDVSAED